MKPSFKNADRPLLCAMVQSETVDEAIAIIANSEYDGAESYGIQLENLRRDQRTEDNLKRLFAACKNRPIYVTCYRNSHSTGMTDDECAEYMLLAAKCGATLIDVMGDLYCPDPIEITYNTEAVIKQERLIKKLHDLGAEVLISSHFHKFIDEEGVVKIAKEQERRGADICKMVSFATTEDELVADLKICHRLKKELNSKFLFLANGAHCKLLRQIGPMLGVCMWLCVQRYRPINSKEQPQLRAMREMRSNMAFF